jgi:hypothetical protein
LLVIELARYLTQDCGVAIQCCGLQPRARIPLLRNVRPFWAR